MFDVCTTGDTAHIDTIFKFLPHTRQHVDACVATLQHFTHFIDMHFIIPLFGTIKLLAFIIFFIFLYYIYLFILFIYLFILYFYFIIL